VFGKQQVGRGSPLQRLFFAFPGGWPGVGLLLLRAGIGVIVLVDGGFYIAGAAESIGRTWIAVLAIASGAALVAGLLTPIAAALTALGAIGITFSLLPPPGSNLPESKLGVVLTAIVAFALVCLGPGAFSADARLFGRREIIIPRRPEP
jgi:uncharacterized membrane protein YphA (DoxX/SURF4 family)